MNIAEATTAYLAIREEARIAPATLRTYRTFIKQPREFAGSAGYLMLDQITPADINVCYANSALGARAERQAPWQSPARFAKRLCAAGSEMADPG